MSTYTGPLPSGEVVTVECPEWCVIDHGDDPPMDIFHRGPLAFMVPPAALSTPPETAIVRQMLAHLVLPAVPQEGERVCISLDLDDCMVRYTELDVEQADNMLAQLREYTERLQTMRDQLAAIHEERKTLVGGAA